MNLIVILSRCCCIQEIFWHGSLKGEMVFVDILCNVVRGNTNIYILFIGIKLHLQNLFENFCCVERISHPQHMYKIKHQNVSFAILNYISSNYKPSMSMHQPNHPSRQKFGMCINQNWLNFNQFYLLRKWEHKFLSS